MVDALQGDGIEHPRSTRKKVPDPDRGIGQLDFLAPCVPGANRAGPSTSVAAVADVLPRVGKQQRLLLLAYSAMGAQGLTNAEAGEKSGLSVNPMCCYWKRIGELQKAGYINETGEERTALGSGSKQAVRAITADGLVLAMRISQGTK